MLLRELTPILRALGLVLMSIRPVLLAIPALKSTRLCTAAAVPSGFLQPFFAVPRPEHENFESFL